MAMPAHVPNCVWRQIAGRGRGAGTTNSATAFSTKTVPIATVISPSAAPRTEPTAAMADPPQMAVPAEIRADVFAAIPSRPFSQHAQRERTADAARREAAPRSPPPAARRPGSCRSRAARRTLAAATSPRACSGSGTGSPASAPGPSPAPARQAARPTASGRTRRAGQKRRRPAACVLHAFVILAMQRIMQRHLCHNTHSRRL